MVVNLEMVFHLDINLLVNYYMKIKFLVLLMILLYSGSLQAQQEWESVNRSFGTWQLGQGLSATSNTLTNLIVRNTTREPLSNSQNKLNYRSAILNMNWKESSSFAISFTLSNTKSDPWQYSLEQVYWGIQFELYKTDGSVVANQLWLAGNQYERFENGEVVSRYSYSANNDGWEYWKYSGDYIKDMNIHILCESNSLSAYFTYFGNSSQLFNRLFAFQPNNIVGIKSISIILGSDAEVAVKNFSVRKKSLSATIKPFMDKGDEYIDKKMWNEAVREYTNAINQGYQNVDIYLRRAYANMMRNQNRSAIEDSNKALSYESNNQIAYYIRGASKLKMDDDTGVADLRKAGNDGLALLRELGLYDYYPSQNNSNTQRRQQTPTQQNILKKDPNFKIE